MKKFGCFVIFIFLGFIAFVTNPSEDEHIDFAHTILKKQGVDSFGINPDYLVIGEGLLGKDNMGNFLKKFIIRKNYYLFSLTEVEIMDNAQIVAVGAFGRLWTLPPFN